MYNVLVILSISFNCTFFLVMRQQRLTKLKFNLNRALLNLRQAVATREVPSLLYLSKALRLFYSAKIVIKKYYSSGLQCDIFVFKVMGPSPA